MLVRCRRVLVHSALFCILIGDPSSLLLKSEESAGPPKSVFGIYGQPGSGHDSIQVTRQADDRVGVNLKLYYSSGHTCQMNTHGKWSEDHLAIVAEGLDPNRPCRLNLYFEDRRVLLKDEGLQCAPVYCGTRGKLDDVSLPKFSSSRNGGDR
jgi:hypothetical protein